MLRPILYLSLMLFSFYSCENSDTALHESIVRIRLPEEPDFLHPMISTHSASSQIENQIFQPLIEFDPIDLLFKPVLATEVAKGTLISDDVKHPVYAFKYHIRKNAKWADGQPVLAKDYVFTVKAANNPMLVTNSWKSFLSTIDTIILDTNDPRFLEVHVRQNEYFSKVMSGNFPIYPQHHYDPKDVLGQYSIKVLRSNDSISNIRLKSFTQRFESANLGRDSVLGSGAYTLTSWAPQRQIILSRNEKWWGDDIASIPGIFNALPDGLSYEIIPDEITSITLLQEGKIDVMSQITPHLFDRLRKDSTAMNKLNFYTPGTMKSYYLALNGWDPILKDIKVRKALAHCLDIDQLIQTLMRGLATRITSPINPQKPYYNDALQPIAYDLNKAAQLLDNAGWKVDTEDGVRSKVLNGKRIKLRLEILITQKELGKKIALVLKNNAAKIGMDIIITPSKWSAISKKLKAHQYQITPMVLSQNPGNDDLSQSWHTSSALKGKNYYGFGNAVTDSIINEINSLTDDKKAKVNYKKIQQYIYDDQPVIFLFTPTGSIAVNNKFTPVISSKRPGYFESLFRLNTLK